MHTVAIIVEYTILSRNQYMPKIVEEFKKLASDQLYKAAQRPKGLDLSGMIIVDYTIFKAVLSKLTEEDLFIILLNNPIRPSTNDLLEVSTWCQIYFEVLLRLDANIKTQADFGQAVGLTQSDISSLLSARKGFYFGEERIEALFSNIKALVERAKKTAS